MRLLVTDARYAIRNFLKRPGFFVIVILTLALGTGATTAIFSIANTVLLKPLPFRNPDRLVHIWENYPKGSRYRWGSGQGYIIVRPATFYDWKSESQSYENMSAAAWRNIMLRGGDKPASLAAHESRMPMSYLTIAVETPSAANALAAIQAAASAIDPALFRTTLRR